MQKIEFNIPLEYRGVLIGKKGANINRVTQQYSVRVIFQKDDSDVIYIRGDDIDSCENAKKDLMHTYQSCQAKNLKNAAKEEKCKNIENPIPKIDSARDNVAASALPNENSKNPIKVTKKEKCKNKKKVEKTIPKNDRARDDVAASAKPNETSKNMNNAADSAKCEKKIFVEKPIPKNETARDFDSDSALPNKNYKNPKKTAKKEKCKNKKNVKNPIPKNGTARDAKVGTSWQNKNFKNPTYIVNSEFQKSVNKSNDSRQVATTSVNKKTRALLNKKKSKLSKNMSKIMAVYLTRQQVFMLAPVVNSIQRVFNVELIFTHTSGYMNIFGLRNNDCIKATEAISNYKPHYKAFYGENSKVVLPNKKSNRDLYTKKLYWKRVDEKRKQFDKRIRLAKCTPRRVCPNYYLYFRYYENYNTSQDYRKSNAR